MKLFKHNMALRYDIPKQGEVGLQHRIIPSSSVALNLAGSIIDCRSERCTDQCGPGSEGGPRGGIGGGIAEQHVGGRKAASEPGIRPAG
jgi:hypothetical protein